MEFAWSFDLTQVSGTYSACSKYDIAKSADTKKQVPVAKGKYTNHEAFF